MALVLGAAGWLPARGDAASAGDRPADAIGASFACEDFRCEIGTDGRTRRFIDLASGTDYCDAKAAAAFAAVTIAGKYQPATLVSSQDQVIRISFGETGVTAELRAISHPHHVVIEVVSLRGQAVEQFAFVDVPLTLRGQPSEPFAACTLALNLQTNVAWIPQPSDRLQAVCFPRFEFAGAKAALLGCPPERLREAMKEAVTAAPELPHSSLGGPWAIDADINRGSYLFNFGGLTEQTVDEWIHLAQSLGITQIDFHGGHSFRFGDCRPNPELYPNGYTSLKAVIDRLHAAGILAGLHTYAFFIAKDCPWVTPVPDPRLGSDATFTLAEAVAADGTTLAVTEPTTHMSTTVGFFERNSVTLRIDQELIVYTGVSKEPPFAFTGCRRGAHGTKPAPHAAGAKVHHLKECFGLFAPGGDSTLLEEVAARTAEAFNECGFDMIYMDALDGEDVLGGRENGWHYGSKFVFEVFKRLNKPPIMEMSTFHHHLWYVRSRMGAWDHPNRSHKKYIDIHCRANADLERMFLPGHLGWWAVKTWTGFQNEPTYADDIEYLCGKCLGHDVGLSIMGIDPAGLKSNPALQRLSGIIRQYETLRREKHFGEALRQRLREPGAEFTLSQNPDGQWQLSPIRYLRHKVQGADDRSFTWQVENPYGEQPPRLRIEALMCAGPYDAADPVVLADFADPDTLTERAAAPGVTVEVKPSPERPKAAVDSGGTLVAVNAGQAAPRGSWAKLERVFDPPLNLAERSGMGVWVHGDGRGELLNLQVTSPPHITRGIGDHYIQIDFTGWRYFELIEPEGERHADYTWPYGGIYSIYREHVDYARVRTFSLWVNALPSGDPCTVHLSPVRALPLVKVPLRNPSLTINGQRVAFAVEMAPGGYLEIEPPAIGRLYGASGELLAEVPPEGDIPPLKPGANEVRFACDGPTDVHPRARVTIACVGDPL